MARRPPKKYLRRRSRRREPLYWFKRKLTKKKARRRPLKPSDLRKRNQLRQRNILIFKIVSFSILGVALIVGAWKLARLDSLTIQRIDLRGLESLSKEEVEPKVFSQLEGNVAGFFPRKNTFFISKRKIKNQLEKDFIVLNSVKVIRKGTDELTVIVKEREPALIFCAIKGDTKETSVNECFFADESGFLFKAIPHLNSSPLYTIYFESEDEKTEEVEEESREGWLGQTILNKKETEALTILTEFLDKESIKVTRITLRNNNSVYLETNQGYSVIFPLKKDYTDEVARFLAALRSDVFKEKHSLRDVYEFDLRYGRKVFYRFHKDQAGDK